MSKKTLVYALASVIFCATISFSALADSASDYVEEARGYVEQGKFKSAIIELKNALQDDPSHLQARLMLGELHLRNVDGAAAAKEFARARDLGADGQYWLPGLARALMMQGGFATLLEEVEVDPALPSGVRTELLALRGSASLALRDADAAVAEFDAALELDPANPSARLGKTQILLSDGRDEEALAELDQLLTEHPSHVASRLVRGDILRRKQRLKEAVADYSRAAQEAPTDSRAYIGLALSHIALRDLEAANQDLTKLNQLIPGQPTLGYLQALVSFQERDFARASDALQQVLRSAPGNLQAQLMYGIVSYAQEEYAIADDYLTRVLASAPGHLQVVKILGATRLKLREPKRAVDVLSGAVNSATEDSQLLALLGTAYLQSGDNSRGAEYIQRAVELDPEQALLRTQLAVGRIAAGDTSAAIDELESAVALGQDVLQADVLLVLSYLNKRQFDKAIAAAEGLEQRMADSPIPFNLSGLAYLAQRDFDKARTKFDQALERDPKFLVARMNHARLALLEEQPEVAAAAYQKVLEQAPRHVAAMLGMAALASAASDAAGAEDWLRKANQADPNALKPVLLLAEGYLRQNEGLKALNILSGLSSEQNDVPAVLRLKGMAQLQNGDFSSAERTLAPLTERQPDSIEAWFQLGRAQAASDNMSAARASFKRATALDVEHKVPVVWLGLGGLELRERRYAAALEVAEILRTHFPENPHGYDVAVAAHRGLGQTEQELAAAEAALRVDPSAVRTRNFVRLLANAGQRDKAVDYLQRWLSDNPDDGAGWASLGMLQQQLGRDVDALTAYEKALAAEQMSPVILNNMAWLYLERNGQRAMELASQAYELAPTRAEIVDTYGWVLFRRGRRDDGLAALQQALVIAPRNAEIGLHVAEVLHAMDRDAEARPLLERIVRENPRSDSANAARELLSRLQG